MINQPIPCNNFHGERAYSVSVVSFEQLTSRITLIRSYSRLRLNLNTHLLNEYYFA